MTGLCRPPVWWLVGPGTLPGRRRRLCVAAAYAGYYRRPALCLHKTSPRSVTESSYGDVFFGLSEVSNRVLFGGWDFFFSTTTYGGAYVVVVMSEGCNPSPGLKGVWGATFFCLSVNMFVLYVVRTW